MSFEDNFCGIIIESSNWWKEKVLNVTGKTDGLINKRDRDVFIKLASGTKSEEDLSGVWHNFTMPDIKVFQFIFGLSSFCYKREKHTQFVSDGLQSIKCCLK